MLAAAAAASSSLMDQLDRLSFGFEKNHTSASASAPTQGLKSKSKSLGALCYPALVRPRGCEFLLHDNMPKSGSPLDLAKLPCVTDGSCPFVRFRCASGHEWNAVPGSPVCMHCPYCPPLGKRQGRVKGLKSAPRNDRHTAAQQLHAKMHAHATSKGGKCLTQLTPESTADAAAYLRYKSSVRFECSRGHQWNATATNILAKKTWCRACDMAKKQDMDYTASKFKGKFLGYVEPEGDELQMTETTRYSEGGGGGEGEQPLSTTSTATSAVDVAETLTASFYRSRSRQPSQLVAKWQCERGHVFYQSPNNIRRRPGGARRCSWCPMCTKEGLVFEWTTDDAFASERRRGSQQLPTRVAKKLS